LRLAIVPRHIERTQDIARLVQQKEFLPLRLSQCRDTKKDARSILIVDSIGHLRALYSLAEIVFVGKTFKVGGGQNMIEPLYFGKPTFVGPLTQNFKDAVQILLKTGALVQVKREEELWQAMREFLLSPQRAEAAGLSAREMINKHQGATQKTLEVISEVLKA
jgi:3-deoxy-D-manno-octulosonic-acid transferase